MKVFDQLPPASPRIGFFRTVAGWKDAALVEFGPEGTMHYAQGSIKGETGNLYTTGMKERQIIFGDTDTLENAIRDIDRNVHPKLLFVTSSPVSEIIGADMASIAFDLQPEISAKLSVWDRVPVEGTQAQGERAAYERAAKYLECLDCSPEKHGFVVLGLTEADWNGIADLGEIRRMAETYFDLPCLNDADGRYCLSDLACAEWILAVTPEAAVLAQKAQELWGSGWHQCMPYGITACEKMIGALENALNRRAKPVWKRERMEARRIEAQLRDRFSHRSQRRVFVDARPSRCDAWAAFLTELGAEVIRPSAQTPAFSTDGGLGAMPEIRDGDILLACGLLCAMYKRNPSLCIEYPAAEQRSYSRYIPLAGIRGVENFVFLFHDRMLRADE